MLNKMASIALNYFNTMVCVNNPTDSQSYFKVLVLAQNLSWNHANRVPHIYLRR